MSVRAFPNGVWCPMILPFDQNEEIDLNAFKRQVKRLATAGMGLVLHGTNGEAAHLSNEERSIVIKAAREVLDANGFKDRPILAGTGAGSAKESVKLCKEAHQAGADYAIVIAPGYFAGAIAKNRPALKAFFLDVLDKSPIPVMIYNFPAAAGGIDLDSDLILELAEHQNCFGTKLTCAMIGKGYRITATTSSAEYKARHKLPFHVLPGYSDYLLPALVARSTGCITGTGNVIPKVIVKLYTTAAAAIKTGDLQLMAKAYELQDIVSEADWTIVKAGIPGTKLALDTFVEQGLGGIVRKPLLMDASLLPSLEKGLARALALEKTL